jgi:hypothetical protein
MVLGEDRPQSLDGLEYRWDTSWIWPAEPTYLTYECITEYCPRRRS